jgi:hypothetical protein
MTLFTFKKYLIWMLHNTPGTSITESERNNAGSEFVQDTQRKEISKF